MLKALAKPIIGLGDWLREIFFDMPEEGAQSLDEFKMRGELRDTLQRVDAVGLYTIDGVVSLAAQPHKRALEEVKLYLEDGNTRRLARETLSYLSAKKLNPAEAGWPPVTLQGQGVWRDFGDAIPQDQPELLSLGKLERAIRSHLEPIRKRKNKIVSTLTDKKLKKDLRHLVTTTKVAKKPKGDTLKLLHGFLSEKGFDKFPVPFKAMKDKHALLPAMILAQGREADHLHAAMWSKLSGRKLPYEKDLWKVDQEANPHAKAKALLAKKEGQEVAAGGGLPAMAIVPGAIYVTYIYDAPYLKRGLFVVPWRLDKQPATVEMRRLWAMKRRGGDAHDDYDGDVHQGYLFDLGHAGYSLMFGPRSLREPAKVDKDAIERMRTFYIDDSSRSGDVINMLRGSVMAFDGNPRTPIMIDRMVVYRMTPALTPENVAEVLVSEAAPITAARFGKDKVTACLTSGIEALWQQIEAEGHEIDRRKEEIRARKNALGTINSKDTMELKSSELREEERQLTQDRRRFEAMLQELERVGRISKGLRQTFGSPDDLFRALVDFQTETMKTAPWYDGAEDDQAYIIQRIDEKARLAERVFIEPDGGPWLDRRTMERDFLRLTDPLSGRTYRDIFFDLGRRIVSDDEDSQVRAAPFVEFDGASDDVELVFE